MLIQAAADEWKVPAAECSAANSVITHKASGRSTTFGKVAEAAAKLEPPKDIKLKDPKDWKIAGKGVKRLDTLDKLTGKQVYGIDIKMPGMLIATIKDCPVNGGKIKSFDAAKVTGMPGVKKVVQVGDTGVAVIADTFWHAKTAIEALPIVWDPGENAKVSSATIAEFLKTGLDADQAYVGNKTGDAPAAIKGAARKVEAVYSYPYQNHATMEPMNATARYTADTLRGLGPDPERRGGAGRPSSRPPGCRSRSATFYKVHPGRRLRPARPHRLCEAGGADRQADAGHAGQADLDARGGHDALRVPSDHAMQDDRRVRCQQQPGRAAHAHLRPVDLGLAGAAEPAERHGPGGVPGPQCGRPGGRSSATTSRTS